MHWYADSILRNCPHLYSPLDCRYCGNSPKKISRSRVDLIRTLLLRILSAVVFYFTAKQNCVMLEFLSLLISFASFFFNWKICAIFLRKTKSKYVNRQSKKIRFRWYVQQYQGQDSDIRRNERNYEISGFGYIYFFLFQPTIWTVRLKVLIFGTISLAMCFV